MKYLFIAIAGLAIACNNNADDKQAEGSVQGQETTACYAGSSGKDTITLSLSTTGDNVIGSLDYKFYEKDRNHGSVSGHLAGDTLIADYIFTSEGLQSIRQVAFLKKENTLIEGHGDMEEKNGKMVFKNTGTLHFTGGFVLQKTACN